MRSYCRPLSDPWLRAALPGLSSFRIFRRQCRRFVRQSNLPRTTPKRNSPTNYATTTFDRFYFFDLFFSFSFFFFWIYISSNEECFNDPWTRFRPPFDWSFQFSNSNELHVSTLSLENFKCDGMEENKWLKSLLQLIDIINYKFSVQIKRKISLLFKIFEFWFSIITHIKCKRKTIHF